MVTKIPKQYIPTPFVKWEVKPYLEVIAESKLLSEVWLKAVTGGKISDEDRNRILSQLESQMYSKTAITLRGWKFPLPEGFLKRFWVKQYDHIQEYYAPSRQSLEQKFSNTEDEAYYEIVEVP